MGARIGSPAVDRGHTTHQEYIEASGARENNLKDVSLRVPKRKITVFAGVSGSGKSYLVFDTVAAEAQRQLNETFTAFVRNFLPRYGQPDADAIEPLDRRRRRPEAPRRQLPLHARHHHRRLLVAQAPLLPDR